MQTRLAISIRIWSRCWRQSPPLSPSPKGEGEAYGGKGEGPTVLFFPSSYRRQVKYGQRDAANEILRTEVLARLSNTPSMGGGKGEALYIVTYPDALSELVVSKRKLDERSMQLRTGETKNVTELEQTLRDFGFHEVDYVYEPGSLLFAAVFWTSIHTATNILFDSTSSGMKLTPYARLKWRASSHGSVAKRWRSYPNWLN